MRVLITDGDSRAALAATRSLGRFHEVWVAAPKRASIAGASRWASRRVALPSPIANPDDFAEQLKRFARTASLDAVFPVSDASCCALLPARGNLACPLLAPSAAAYGALSDKANAAVLARRHGLEVPRGVALRGPERAIEAARDLGFPVIIKPQSVVRVPGGTLEHRSVTKVSTVDELCKSLRGLDGETVLVQECVPGRGEGVSMLRWAGRLRAAFAHRRVREKPPEGGVSVVSESISCDEDRVQRLAQILDEVDYNGLVMAEFKTTEEESWLIEFNARPWGSMQLAVDAGVDFPVLLMDCVLGRPPPERPGYEEGRLLRWCLGDLDHALAVARGRTATDGRCGVRAALGSLFTRIGPYGRFELLRASDSRPFALALWRWIQGRPA